MRKKDTGSRKHRSAQTYASVAHGEVAYPFDEPIPSLNAIQNEESFQPMKTTFGRRRESALLADFEAISRAIDCPTILRTRADAMKLSEQKFISDIFGSSVDFHGLNFRNNQFSGAIFPRSDFRNSVFENVEFVQSNVSFGDFADLSWNGGGKTHIDLDCRGTWAINAKIKSQKFVRSNFSHAVFCGSDLNDVSFDADTDLSYCDFRRAKLHNTDLSLAKGNCVDLRGADLTTASLPLGLEVWERKWLFDKHTKLPHKLPTNPTYTELTWKEVLRDFVILKAAYLSGLSDWLKDKHFQCQLS